MCLRQYVSRTPFHPELPLRYAVDGEIHTSEVPACQINLVIPAGFDFTLLVKNTEPGNVTRISGDELLIQEECWGMCPAAPYTYSLLASDELLSVCDEGPLIPDD